LSVAALFRDPRLSTEVRTLPFAGPIKQVFRLLYPDVPLRHVYGTDEEKANYIPGVGKTVRQALQHIGQTMRAFEPEIWERMFTEAVSAERQSSNPDPLLVIADDVRMPSEVALVRSMGGKVIRLTRSLHTDSHVSETALDDVGNFDLTIHNASMTPDDTMRAVYSGLASWGWIV
jgi:hypothetical protein